jgi:hypothetical protein
MRLAGLQANCGRRIRHPIRETSAFHLLIQVAMDRQRKDPRPEPDLDEQAQIALEAARRLKPGPERTEAMKRAGTLRNAADLQGLFFARRGRPPKT